MKIKRFNESITESYDVMIQDIHDDIRSKMIGKVRKYTKESALIMEDKEINAKIRELATIIVQKISERQ
jgi:hypothetical protein